MRRVPEDPGTVLFGKTRRRVLGLLFARPDESFYVRDIVRRSGAAHGAIARELTALLGAGLVWRDERGRRVYYKANKHAPIFPELERLVGKTLVVGDLLRDALEALGDRVELAGLFGRAVTGEVAPDRAIDLLVIGDVRREEVVDAVKAVEARLDQPVKAVVYEAADYRKAISEHPPTFVPEPKLFVIGGRDDFRRLRGLRPPPLRRRRRRLKEGFEWSRPTD
jgi:DNA-binding transcriptional ArsR family regulator